MIAAVSPDLATITLKGRAWSATFPSADLPNQLRFYRALRDRGAKSGQTGQYAKHYQPTVAALEKAEKLLRVMGRAV